MTPTEFWEDWSNRDQAFAIARNRAEQTMKSWEDWLHEKEMKRK